MTSFTAVRIASIALFLCAFDVWAIPVYQAMPLDFAATALNNRGQIVGSRNGHAVIWDRGRILSLGTGSAIDVNNRGQVLGSDWLWDSHAGRSTPGFVGAAALNDRGEVAGDFDGYAFVWRITSGSASIRYLGESRYFDVHDLSNRGDVLLDWDAVYGVQRWRGENDMHLLPPVLVDGCCVTLGRAVFNNAGYIAGLSLIGVNPPELLPDLPPGEDDCGGNGCDAITLWTPSLEPVYIGLHSLEDRSVSDHGPRHAGVTGLNSRLQLVGSFASFAADEYRAYVATQSWGVLDLNELLSNEAIAVLGDSVLKGAQGINDRGWILATNSEGRSYLLVPVPEPESLALFVLAALAAAAGRRVRTLDS